MLVVSRLTWMLRSAVVALELSCRSCWPCGDGAPDVADDAPDDADEPADPDVCDVEELPVLDLPPQPVMTVATRAAANKIATDTVVEGRRETGRWEICACGIKPFMASLC